MTKSLVEQQFGAHAAAYASSAVHAKGASLQRLVELAAPQAGWRVLDVATGAGHTAAAFAPHVASVVAGDVTPEMLAEAAKLASERGFVHMTTARVDADALPFADAGFDLVTCRIAAHHFAEPARFVAEATRVLAPGGLLALVDNVAPDAAICPAFKEYERDAAATAYNDFERARDASHARALGVGEWLALLAGAGLALRHVELLRKQMHLRDWAQRMGCDAAAITGLAAILDQALDPAARDGATRALGAFLAPERAGRDRMFHLTEAIILAAKPA